MFTETQEFFLDLNVASSLRLIFSWLKKSTTIKLLELCKLGLQKTWANIQGQKIFGMWQKTMKI